MTITGAQVKAARQLLGWTPSELGGQTGVSSSTIGHLEGGKCRPSVLIVSTVQRALEAAGIEFVRGEPDVKLSKAGP